MLTKGNDDEHADTPAEGRRDRRSNEPNRTAGANWTVYTSSLVSLEATDRPPGPLPSPVLEVELRHAGRAYLEHQQANRSELARLAQEASTAGLPADAVAHVAGVPVDDIRRLTATRH
jgi:hypothetical protein